MSTQFKAMVMEASERKEQKAAFNKLDALFKDLIRLLTNELVTLVELLKKYFREHSKIDVRALKFN